jgi:NAD(P)-dependent dehydrogenase (short-subunit alcohol dehydrogenase family)
MQNKTTLITGSTDGIDKETARQLAQLGATVIVHGRNADRCEAVRDDTRSTTGNPRVDFVVAKANDVNLWRKLWDISAQLVGLPEVRQNI